MFTSPFASRFFRAARNGVAGFALVVCCVTPANPCLGDDKQALADVDKAFRKFAVRRSGPNLMLDDEAKLKKCLDGEKSIKNEMKKKYPDFQAMEQEDHMRTASVPMAFERMSEIDQLLGQNLPVQQHNQLVSERNALQNKVNKVRTDKLWPEQVRKSRAEFNRIREKYMENLLEARKTANTLDERWKELESNEEFTKLAEEAGTLLNQSVVAGPSRTFRKMLTDLEKLEGNVLSDTIPLQSSGGNTFSISVTVNGKETVDMILDSGAGIISLPAATAAQIGVVVTEASPDIRLSLADGRIVTAKMVTIPLVRVGRFEAREVDAAVLPPELVNAEPLLGMSFLKNFQFKVDSDAKTLTMVEVGMADEAVKKGSKSNGKDKKK